MFQFIIVSIENEHQQIFAYYTLASVLERVNISLQKSIRNLAILTINFRRLCCNQIRASHSIWNTNLYPTRFYKWNELNKLMRAGICQSRDHGLLDFGVIMDEFMRYRRKLLIVNDIVLMKINYYGFGCNQVVFRCSLTTAISHLKWLKRAITVHIFDEMSWEVHFFGFGNLCGIF